MRLRRSQLRILLAFLLMIPIGFMIMMDEESSRRSSSAVEVVRGVDYFIQNAHSKSFDKKGSLTSTLTVSEFNHFPNKALSELTSPSMVSYESDGSTLTANSNKGRLFDKDNRLQLDEAVKVEHNSSTGETSILTTSTLTLLKAGNIAETDVPVTISSRGSITQADGIRVDFKARTTELSSNVKGTYHVNQ